jgi:hypothetical protein
MFFKKKLLLEEEVYNNLKKLSYMSVDEYLLYRKFQEIQERSFLEIELDEFKNNIIANYFDIIEFFEKGIISIEMILADSPKEQKIWKIAATHIAKMEDLSIPGRGVKFNIYINKKLVGITQVAMDYFSLKKREDFIGWNKENKKIGITSFSVSAPTIVPTQPFGYLTNGGKLLCLLLYSKILTDTWFSKYNFPIVGITTTSLYGLNSQYLGMPKYWKVLGESKGTVNYYIDNELYNKVILLLQNKDIYKNLGPYPSKSKIVGSFYKNFLKSYIKINSLEELRLNNNFKRGIFYAPIFKNSLEFLNGKYSNLEERDLDFDRNNLQSIFNFWYRKYAKNRFLKVKDICDKEVFFMNKEQDINTFIEQYKRVEK